MNGIQGTKPVRRKWNRLLYAVITILKYKKSTIYHAIYIKVFSDRSLSCLTFSTDDVINTTNNETDFTELRRVFEEALGVKVQEGYVLRYLNFRNCQFLIGFSVDETDHNMEIVN